LSRSEVARSPHGRSQGALGLEVRKLQPRLRMVANGGTEVNAVRCEQSSALAVDERRLPDAVALRAMASRSPCSLSAMNWRSGSFARQTFAKLRRPSSKPVTYARPSGSRSVDRAWSEVFTRDHQGDPAAAHGLTIARPSVPSIYMDVPDGNESQGAIGRLLAAVFARFVGTGV
jgi:hypothetical protein